MKKIGLFLFVITALGCSREPIDGAVYVIKGDGKITPAAAIDVYALPFKSVSDFEEARVQFQRTSNALVLKEYVSEVCGVFPEKSKKQIEYNIKQAERFSETCKSETEKTVLLTSNNKDPEKLKSLLDRKRVQRGKTAGVVETQLLRKSDDRIKISYDYAALSFGEVYITNNSKFWVIHDLFFGFANDVPVTSCGIALKIAPMTTYKFSLGGCGTLVAGTKLMDNGRVKICRRSKYSNIPCHDEFGTSKYNAGVYSPRGEWNFYSKSTKETVLESIDSYEEINFMELALQSSEIKNLDREIAAIESDLRKSQLSFNNLNACEIIQSKLDNLENITCPALDSKRDKVKSFVATVTNLGVSVRDVPPYQLQGEEGFAISQATAIMVTNIDGRFIFDNPTNSEFLFYAKYQDNFNTMEWMVPVEIDVKSIELNNTNSL